MAKIAPVPFNTPAGNNISVQPTDPTTNGSPVTLTFPTVTEGGDTTLATSNSGPPPAQGFQLGSPPTYYNLTTTAVYTGPITICINYSGVSFNDPNELAIWHYDTTAGSWAELATTINTATTTACATTPSLSPFAVLEPAYAAQVQPPINANGSSAFKASRGVVPVKFTLTYGGVATCQLPPARISLIRTAGAVLGSVDGSVYLLASDSGSNFRSDGCQYVYNLATSSLGTGKYMVNISIGGHVVGSGIFGLQ